MATNSTRPPKPFDVADSPVRRERLKRGWSVIALATAAGLSPASIVSAERGYCPAGVTRRLARALGLSERAIRPPQDDPEAA
jgi:transcriptional regulator with XRE-family HTH domain